MFPACRSCRQKSPAPRVRRSPKRSVRLFPRMTSRSNGSSEGANGVTASTPAGFQYEPIAIIGMGCRFPRAPDLATFWQNLRARMDCITEITADRWNVRSYFDPDRGKPGRSDSKWAGLVENLEEFDAGFFGISSRE